MVPNIQKGAFVEQQSTLKQLKESVPKSSIATNDFSKMTAAKNYHRSSSWQALHPDPDFNIGLIIDSTSIKDAHVSAINKPASRCQLVSAVVLHPSESEMNSLQSLKDSVRRWLKANNVTANVEELDFIGTGQTACGEMLCSDSIDAVYVIVPPRYVESFSHWYFL